MRRVSRLFYPLALTALVACSDSSNGTLDPAISLPNPVFGQLAFEESCAGCHASRDGYDLKTFGFADTTIIRRAVKHVDSTSARNIAAHILGLNAPSNNAAMHLFQPKGAPLNSDVEFANSLFGRDEWPVDLTTAQLVAIDPRTVQVAVRLPVWSDESSNMDWMPDFVLPEGILDYSGSLARSAIAGYDAAPTDDNLVRAVNALRNADRAAANPSAPCRLGDVARVKYRECFEVRRWTSTLVALHMLRNGMDVQLAGRMQDVWWDVGNAARTSRADRSVPIANADQNWATWMFLGWSFDPSLNSSVYTGGGFRQVGLMRHATFVALRSEVARSKNSPLVYEDLLNTAKFAPSTWVLSAVSFGLRHLDERLKSGDRPGGPYQPGLAISQVNATLTEAYKKVPVEDRPQLAALAAPVLAALQ